MAAVLRAITLPVVPAIVAPAAAPPTLLATVRPIIAALVAPVVAIVLPLVAPVVTIVLALIATICAVIAALGAAAVVLGLGLLFSSRRTET